MTPLDRLARDLAALDRLMGLDDRLTVLSFRPERRLERLAAREPSPLPAVLVERVAKFTTTERRDRC